MKDKEWRVMQAYIAHSDCLMRFLATELDDPNPTDCGRCANCCPAGALSSEFSVETGKDAVEFMGNVTIEIPSKKRAGFKTQIRERFPAYQFPCSFGHLAHAGGRALCRWGEAGWGEIATGDKKEGEFGPAIIKESAKLIKDRWGPEPFPEWVTFVPSLNRPTLVADFARALARELGLECREAVFKIKANKAQKTMENTHHRCINLDGVFEIRGHVPEAPVLLVDDAFDSGWTFAVIAALLRQEGSGSVFPFAVLSTSTTA
jgi:ATP-dependent DNA helicase RecQ